MDMWKIEMMKKIMSTVMQKILETPKCFYVVAGVSTLVSTLVL
jgi:hypothetical protein